MLHVSFGGVKRGSPVMGQVSCEAPNMRAGLLLLRCLLGGSVVLVNGVLLCGSSVWTIRVDGFELALLKLTPYAI